MSKLQKECRDMQVKEKDSIRDLQKVKEQMDSVLKESQALKGQMAELVEDRITLKLQIESQREKLELSINETAQHRDKALTLEEEIRGLKLQLRQFTELQSQFDKAKILLDKNHED